MYHFSGFRMLTSIISPTLLPCNFMCLTNLQTCTTNVEVERCARSDFPVPFSAVIPLPHASKFRIDRRIAQISSEFLDATCKTGEIFEYLPTLVSHAP
jgi:hypothetical protein